MTWVKIDDGMPDHPKVVGLSDAAFRLHVTALCYSGKYLTDGVVPEAALARLGGDAWGDAVEELVHAGLWDEGLCEFSIHDYLKHQTSKEQVEGAKKAANERVRNYRERKKGGNAVGNAVTPVADVTVLVTHPDTDTDTDNSLRSYGNEVAPLPRVRSALAAVERIGNRLADARNSGVNAWNLSRLVEEEWDTLHDANDIGGCIALTVWYVSELQSRALTSAEISRIGQMTKRFGRIALLAIDEAASKDLTDLPSYAFRVAQTLYKERQGA